MRSPIAVTSEANDSAAVAAQINGVTKDGQKGTSCANCLPLIKEGIDIGCDGSIKALDACHAIEPVISR